MVTKLLAAFQTHEMNLVAVVHWLKHVAAGPQMGFLFLALALVQLKSNYFDINW